jgi:hypothetical protein
MTGFNMPPGVNPSDIPGNRPEDLEEDKFWAAFDKELDAIDIKSISLQRYPGDDTVIQIEDLWDDDNFVKLIQLARDLGFNKGYITAVEMDAMHYARKENE